MILATIKNCQYADGLSLRVELIPVDYTFPCQMPQPGQPLFMRVPTIRGCGDPLHRVQYLANAIAGMLGNRSGSFAKSDITLSQKIEDQRDVLLSSG